MALRVVGAEPLGAGGGARSGGALSAGTHAQVKLTTKARFSFQSRGRDVFFGWFILDGDPKTGTIHGRSRHRTR